MGPRRLRAHLLQLLDHVERGGLCVAVDDRNLRGFHLLDLVSDHQIFATALWPDDNEGISLVEPGLDHRDVSLDSYRLHDWWQILVLQVVDLGLTCRFWRKWHPLPGPWVEVVQEQVCRVGCPLTCQVHHELSQLGPEVEGEVASKALNASASEVALARDLVHVAEGVIDDAYLGSLNDEVLLSFEGPSKRLFEDVLEPGCQIVAMLLLLLVQPSLGDSSDVDVLLGQEDHSEPTDRGWRGVLHLMGLKNEVDVASEIDSLAVGQSEQMVVVKHGVQGFHPFWIDISIVDDPAVGLEGLFHDETGACCQNAILKLPRVVVHEAKELMAGHGLRVHRVRHDALVQLLERQLENFPDCGLSTTGGAHKNDPHPLPGGLIKLQYFLDLLLDVLKLELLEGVLDGPLQRLVGNILGLDPWEHVGLEVLVLLGVRVGQLGDGVYSDGLDQQQSLRCVVELHALLEFGLDELAAGIQDGLQSPQPPIVVLLRR